MIHRYWVATFKIPRGHRGHKVQLPPGERISRLLEWKVDLSRDGMLVTALMEETLETIEEPEPAEAPQQAEEPQQADEAQAPSAASSDAA